eukprot:1463279-Pyramimonas_sp.AAC.1
MTIHIATVADETTQLVAATGATPLSRPREARSNGSGGTTFGHDLRPGVRTISRGRKHHHVDT